MQGKKLFATEILPKATPTLSKMLFFSYSKLLQKGEKYLEYEELWILFIPTQNQEQTKFYIFLFVGTNTLGTLNQEFNSKITRQ